MVSIGSESQCLSEVFAGALQVLGIEPLHSVIEVIFRGMKLPDRL